MASAGRIAHTPWQESVLCQLAFDFAMLSGVVIKIPILPNNGTEQLAQIVGGTLLALKTFPTLESVQREGVATLALLCDTCGSDVLALIVVRGSRSTPSCSACRVVQRVYGAEFGTLVACF